MLPFWRAGHEGTVATPYAVVPTVDTMSLRPGMAGSEQMAREEEDVIEATDPARSAAVAGTAPA
jgi:hypothetical protein